MPLAMVIVVFMCWFLSYSFRRESLEYNYEQIDSNLTYSLLAAAIINFNEYAVSGNLIISDGAEPEVWDSLMELNAYGPEIRDLVTTIRERGDCLSLKELAVKGQDLIAAGVKPGKEMGTMLHELLEHVLKVPQDNKKETLLKLLVDLQR